MPSLSVLEPLVPYGRLVSYVRHLQCDNFILSHPPTEITPITSVECWTFGVELDIIKNQVSQSGLLSVPPRSFYINLPIHRPVLSVLLCLQKPPVTMIMQADLSLLPSPGRTDISENALFGSAKTLEGYLSYADRIQLSLKRAKAIIDAHGNHSSSAVDKIQTDSIHSALTVHDIETLTRAFWDVHTDHAMAMDTGAGTLVAIQLNLVAGTLVKYLKDSSYVQSLMDDVLSFNVLCVLITQTLAHQLMYHI